MTKICPQCGREFETENIRQAYCSDRCRRQYGSQKQYGSKGKKPLLTKECPMCHKIFYTARAKQIYCGPECRQKIKNQKNREMYAKHAEIKKSERPKVVCVICGKVFYQAYTDTQTCSSNCRNQLLKLNRMEKNPHANREFYPGTVGLIHKWYQGGDTVEDIMMITERSRENVLEALATPLTPAEERALEEGVPYRNTRRLP